MELIMEVTKAKPKASLQDTVSMNLKILLMVRSLKQEDLAEALGISRPAVSQKITGKHPWSLGDIEKASEFFNVEPEALVAGHGFEPWTSGL
ncbi:helix-turn-helix domain-containing protein [Alloscardovia omnicolens]|uniref:helix-turn-helix domain-containing protein n=2 Tax=Alloscardovia omnicolens TaxID=419015 RepID=UPI0032B3DF56